ncbi:hypothetical protein SS50377_21846 [Spironucleus salmonicida]|uniref:Uncharacterized protein n=1 Tax=Spironucleus salmonicida TaxID=348837 RepID=V6LIH4_9EUKA|nr:hypothetical protein SS50377_21846 [Spironucleus salmonicida]|eukprot:EST44390.1 Hypothetical protein SS50377_15693 [Spironucleus salmonicida]
MTISVHCKSSEVGCKQDGFCDIANGFTKDIRIDGCVCQTSRIQRLVLNDSSKYTCPWDYMLTIIILVCILCTIIATPFIIKWYKYIEMVLDENDRIEKAKEQQQTQDV